MGRRLRIQGAGLSCVILATMLTLSACGSPSASPGIASANTATPAAGATSATKSSSNADGLKFAQCMREHGVQMADPVDGRIEIQSGPGQESTVEAAQKACAQYAPGAGGTGAKQDLSQADQAKLLKFAQCMREHGVPMADPDFSGGGVQMKVQGGAKTNEAKAQAAQQACAKLMPAGMEAGPGSAKTGGGSGQSGTGSSS